MKRLFDMVVSVGALLVASPFMVLVGLLIKLDSKGPVIFKQERVGRYGQMFLIYKYRSMVVDAEIRGPHYTSLGDPRITKLGRIIRKTSIDELPQLLNVLKGDMSVVGPRPDVPVQRVAYTELEWDKRTSVRPGITGLAQALLRSDATAEQRTRLDLEYVDKSSLFFDIWIILMTVKQVLFRGGN